MSTRKQNQNDQQGGQPADDGQNEDCQSERRDETYELTKEEESAGLHALTTNDDILWWHDINTTHIWEFFDRGVSEEDLAFLEETRENLTDEELKTQTEVATSAWIFSQILRPQTDISD